jgi:hypothetical protein
VGWLSQGEATVTACWVESAQGSDFSIENLPLGIFSVGNRRRRAGVAIGDFVLDLVAIADLLDEEWRADLAQPVLNGWLARGPQAQAQLRERLQELLSDERYRDDVEPELIGQTEARMHVPCLVGDYTDFYVGIHHATNVGKQLGEAFAERLLRLVPTREPAVQHRLRKVRAPVFIEQFLDADEVEHEIADGDARAASALADRKDSERQVLEWKVAALSGFDPALRHGSFAFGNPVHA